MTTVADTNPYPWPHDEVLDPKRYALLVCGAQEALVAASPDAAAVLSTIGALAASLRALGVVVVWIRHGSRVSTRPTWLPDPAHAAWALTASPGPTDLVIDAAGWDASYGSTLDHELRALGRDHLVLTGVASEITVDSTVRTLNDRGYECLVLTDGCAPVDPELGRRAHASLTMSGGIFGALGTSAALLSALTRTETTP